jgi:hypothetical protein
VRKEFFFLPLFLGRAAISFPAPSSAFSREKGGRETTGRGPLSRPLSLSSDMGDDEIDSHIFLSLSNLPYFVSTTHNANSYDLVEDPGTDSIISWAADGLR